MAKNPPAKLETRVRSLGQKVRLGKDMEPTPVFSPGKSQAQRSLVAAVHGVTKSQTHLSDSTTTVKEHNDQTPSAVSDGILVWGETSQKRTLGR